MSSWNEIRELLSRAPRAPEDALPDGLTGDSIERLEERLGFRFPSMLREWLEVTNGARMGPGGFFGVNAITESLDIESYLKEYPEWIENRWLPVAGDGSGNYYVIDAGRADGRSPVLFVDTHEDPREPAYIAASDLWHFLRFVLRKECGDHGWPFSRDKVVAEDPSIIAFDDLAYPWSQ